MDKRGDISFLVGIIVLIVGGIIIAFIYNSFQTKIIKTADIEICKFAVDKTALKVAGFRALEGDELKGIRKNCPVNTRYFKEKKNGKPRTDEENNALVLEIAKDINNCWTKFGKAEVDFISGWNAGSILCLPCGVYRSETDIEINSGHVLSKLENKTYFKNNINLAINTGRIKLNKIEEFSDKEIKKDFYDKDKYVPGLYVIYVASKDQASTKTNINPDESLSDYLYSKVQDGIRKDKNFRTNDKFINPKVGDNFFSMILITDNNDQIQKYCGRLYNKHTYYKPREKTGEFLSRILDS